MMALNSMKQQRRLIFLAVCIFHRTFLMRVDLVSVNVFAVPFLFGFVCVDVSLFEVYCVKCLV